MWRRSCRFCQVLPVHFAELSRIAGPGVGAAALPWRPARRTPGHTARGLARSPQLTPHAGPGDRAVGHPVSCHASHRRADAL